MSTAIGLLSEEGFGLVHQYKLIWHLCKECFLCVSNVTTVLFSHVALAARWVDVYTDEERS